MITVAFVAGLVLGSIATVALMCWMLDDQLTELRRRVGK